MANKNKKRNIAIIMALLQELDNPNKISRSAATASILQTNLVVDGADRQDVIENIANNQFDQNKDTYSKIRFELLNTPDLVDELDIVADKYNLQLTDLNLNELRQLFKTYLKDNEKYISGYAQGGQFEMPTDFIDVEIAGKPYHLLHLTSESQKEEGLKNVESMNPDEGALFDYSDNPQESMDFWMKDTTIPLDIIFINENGIVISVKQGVPESEDLISESSEFVAYVIELNASSGVKAGDETSLGKTIEETDPDEDESAEDEYPELQINHLIIYGSDGQPQGYLSGGERIFSRKSTRVIIRKAKRAYKTQSDADFKALGRYVFNEMKAQDNRKPEYTS